LTYNLKIIEGTLLTLGGHNTGFKNPSITIFEGNEELASNITSNYYTFPAGRTSGEFTVTVTGTSNGGSSIDDAMWIQPNRDNATSVTCEISNIKVEKTITSEETIKDYERTAHFYLNVDVTVGEGVVVPRTYSMSCNFPAGASTASVSQTISPVDVSRSDV
jgi:hypothetical protein